MHKKMTPAAGGCAALQNEFFVKNAENMRILRNPVTFCRFLRLSGYKVDNQSSGYSTGYIML